MLRNSFLCRDEISRDLSIDLVAIMQQLVISVLPIRYSSGYNESCTANCNPSLFRRKTPIWLQCNIWLQCRFATRYAARFATSLLELKKSFMFAESRDLVLLIFLKRLINNIYICIRHPKSRKIVSYPNFLLHLFILNF